MTPQPIVSSEEWEAAWQALLVEETPTVPIRWLRPLSSRPSPNHIDASRR